VFDQGTTVALSGSSQGNVMKFERRERREYERLIKG
jgi:hypothetical protein